MYIYIHNYTYIYTWTAWCIIAGSASLSAGGYTTKKRPFRFKGFSTTHPVGNSTEIHMDFIWLVVSTPLKNMKVNLWKNKFMFQTTNQLWFIQYVQGISYESHPPTAIWAHQEAETLQGLPKQFLGVARWRDKSWKKPRCLPIDSIDVLLDKYFAVL